jgi:hypothetical protein
VKKLSNGVLALLCALWIGHATAAEVAGVKLDDKARVGSAELQLNGAGLRTKVFFKVYVIGLYLPEKKSTADAVLGEKGAKRLQISTLRELDGAEFADSLASSIEKNATESELAALKTRIEDFKAAMTALKTAQKGTLVQIDWLPESGTRLAVGGQQKGKDIAGEDFYRALLKIWLGGNPAQDDLKEAPLGKPQ